MDFVAARVERFGQALDVASLPRRVHAFVRHTHGELFVHNLALQFEELILVLLQQLFVLVL